MTQRRKRRLVTRRSVRVAERLSTTLITAGGMGTICAIVLIFVFLLSVVVPLFRGATHGEATSVPAPGGAARHVQVDEYGLLAAILGEDWRVRVVSLRSGEVLEDRPLLEDGPTPTAWSVSVDGKSMAFGFEDGSIRLGAYEFASSFPTAERVPADLPEVGAEPVEHQGAVFERTPEGKLRRQAFRFRLEPPLQLAERSPVRLVSHVSSGEDDSLVAWTEARGLLALDTEERTNLLTGETELEVEETPIDLGAEGGRGRPARLILLGAGTDMLVLHEDGATERLDLRDPESARVAERIDLAPAPGEHVTATALLVGNNTLVTGTSRGAITAWFGAKRETAGTVDGKEFVPAHPFQGPDAEVVSLAASPRSRVLAAAFADGSVEAYHVTSGQRLLRLEPDPEGDPGPLRAIRVLPKEDGLLALGETGIVRWEVDFRHPEATVASLFTPVWYETYPEPQHVWQSEGATDDFEPKLGFVPLVYGTLKATFYSMLFGGPLAILAALFTSEFLDRRLRVPIKSAIEMMASLPSVVLGFLAGIVIAPVAQDVLPAVLASFVTVPVVLLLAAHLWQLAPQRLAIAWSGWQRLVLMAAALPVGFGAALVVGPLLELLFFGGSVELWLDGQVESAVGGWLFLLLPAATLLVAVLGGRGYGGWVRRKGADWSRLAAGRVDLVKFLGGLGLVLAVALAAALLLDGVGLDPRGTLVDTYDPRNALIVGIVMGFAIVPIIYSLAEDALSSVPEHLRLASLGAGATPWQTAVRVIVPTAMSGIFSAVMIGLGRAVGETMIVLMATGNTPIMDLNVFNGFRTLSANIAVELPEAVQGSTHYRALFLAAFVLFGMTFVLNTFAEGVRLRFRRRAFQL